VQLGDSSASVGNWIGTTAPLCVLLNPSDVAYGLFILDPVSRAWICDHALEIEDLLLRATAMSALFNTVREAELDPTRYLATAVQLLEHERDPETHAWLLDTIATTVGRYVPDAVAENWRTKIGGVLTAQLETGPQDLALQSLRFLVRHCPTPGVLAIAERHLDSTRGGSRLALGSRDRFLLAAALLAHGDGAPLAAERQNAAGDDRAKEIYTAEAAAADPDVKRRYVESYAKLGEIPEQWMQDSLSFFHWPGQSALTLPHLEHALEQVEWV
jgi:hypothetical protein